MTSLNHRTDVWYEKYRPNSLDEIVLPEKMKLKIREYLKDGGFNMPHLGLFSYTPGTGKSSLAKVILKETNAEALWINASMDRGIDVLRTKIQRFASQAPLREAVKIVVMDEFDSFSQEGQRAFRGFIDEFGKNVRFIFTGNYAENILGPLLDRMEVHDFNQFKKEDIVKPIYLRLKQILDREGIEYSDDDVKMVIGNEYPKIRQMIGVLGASVHNNRLDLNYNSQKEDLDHLGDLVKSKDYEKILKATYSLGVTDHIFGYYSKNLDKIVKQEQNLNAIIILAKYQHMHTTAKDRNLNAAACMAELAKL